MSPVVTDDTLFCALLVQQAYRRDERPLVEVTTDVLTGARTAYIAVKGTDSLADVWADLRRSRVPFFSKQVGLAHSGFVAVAESVMCCDDFRRQLEGVHRLVFTGHSLGGAVATLLATVYATVYSVPVDVVTFGSPRVCNGSLARYFNRVVRNSLRITHDRDPIPRVPFFGYKHVKGRCVFGDDGKLIGRIKGGLHTLLFWLRFRRRDLGDHMLSMYVRSIEQHLAGKPDPLDEPTTPWGQP
jgi:hypothetical protein